MPFIHELQMFFKKEETDMGKVYFVRHGQTYWNVENKICGATDIALTPTGHEQAIRTGKEDS